MCIIVCKPKDVELPGKAMLKNCFLNNNDGAGFCYAKDNRIYLSKGYSKFKSFYRAIRGKVTKETPAILHFRIASIGKVSDTNCHPFVISEDKREINKTENCTRLPVFAHNGNLSIREKNNKSDTRQFAHFMGDPVIRDNIFRSNNMMKLLEESIGFSKMAFMNRKGDIKLIGDFPKEHGVSFSNYTFRYKTSSHSLKGEVWDRKNRRWVKREEEEENEYSPLYAKTEAQREDEAKAKKEIIVPPSSKNVITPTSEDIDLHRYLAKFTACEMCGRDDGSIHYYTKPDIALCEFCYAIYYVEADYEQGGD